MLSLRPLNSLSLEGNNHWFELHMACPLLSYSLQIACCACLCAYIGDIGGGFCSRSNSTADPGSASSVLLGHNQLTGTLDLSNCTGLFTLDVSVSVCSVCVSVWLVLDLR